MDPQPGTWCVIAGAAGGLGHLAIQYPKCFGLRVLAIDGGGTDKEGFCRDMGADTYAPPLWAITHDITWIYFHKGLGRGP